MWRNRFKSGMVVSAGGLLLFALYLSRKPLCIDSRFIERIDRLENASAETVWSCRYDKSSAWNPAFIRHLPGWEKRLKRTEDQLRRIEPLMQPVRIVVLADRPWAFRVDRGVIFIGERLMAADGHLERALIKSWLAERTFATGGERAGDEALADMIYGMTVGPMGLEDPRRSLRTRAGARWPTTIKNVDAYCDSPWKFSEHFEVCDQNRAVLEAQVWQLSLRPLMASALLGAWQSLPLRQRIDLYRRLPRWIFADVSPSEREPGLSAAADTMLRWLRQFEHHGMGDSSVAALAAHLQGQLQQLGFAESEPVVQLDFMIFSDQILNPQSADFKRLTAFAAARPTLKVAVKDPRGLRWLPSRVLFPEDQWRNVRADHAAVLRCGRFDFDWILSFADRAEKLVVMDACTDKLPDLRPWMSQGIEAFAAANRRLKFVQFHIPSLSARRDAIDRTTDVLSIIQKRDISDPLFRSLGWSELRWSANAEAYRPRALVDAIEWFRLN